MRAQKPRGATPARRTAVLRAAGLSDATTGAGVAVRRKFDNVPVEIGGLRFDSKKEAERYGYLLVAEQLGEISGLDYHTRFPLVVHGQDCGYYEADFTYLTATGERVVEDVKSPVTRKLPTYRLKRKLLWALYGLTVREV